MTKQSTLIGRYETARTKASLFATNYERIGQPLYILLTKHPNSKVLLRYGTKAQIMSLLKAATYSTQCKFSKEIEDFMKGD